MSRGEPEVEQPTALLEIGSPEHKAQDLLREFYYDTDGK